MASRTKTTEAARGDRELTLKAAAEMTGCSGKLLRRHIREGRLRPASMDGNRMTVTLAALREAGLLPSEPGGMPPIAPGDDRDDDPADEMEERAEQERAERERAERERAERERAEKERAEKERAEKERVDRERAEKERGDRERAEKERAEKERAEKERAEKERAERARLEKERAERERAERERSERARAEKERAEKERVAKERAERERAEKARAEREKSDRERAERERAARERAEAEKAERARAEKERVEREQAEKARLERERAEREKAERARAERDRVKEEKAESERRRAEAAKVVPLARPKPAAEELDDIEAPEESDELDEREIEEIEEGLDDLQDGAETVRLQPEPRVEVVGEAMPAERSLVVAGSGPWVTTNQLTDLMRMLAAEREARSQEYVERTEALYREMIETQKLRIGSLEEEARSLQAKLEDALRMVPKGENVSALEQMVRDLRIEIDRKEAARADLEHERDRLRDLTDRLRNDLSRADKRNLEMAEQLRRFRAQGIFDRLVGREPDDR